MAGMRVMHFISGDLWAGAEAMAATLNTELHACPDLHLLVLLLNDGRLAEILTDAGVEVAVLNEGQRSFASLLAAARGLTGFAPSSFTRTATRRISSPVWRRILAARPAS